MPCSKSPCNSSSCCWASWCSCFYQFEQPPVFFNEAAWKYAVKHDSGAQLQSLEQKFNAIHVEKEQLIHHWLDAKHAGNREAEAQAQQLALAADGRSEAVRAEARTAVLAAQPGTKSNDADYVFITFILDYLPLILSPGLNSPSSRRIESGLSIVPARRV
jgi:hypothetical protein